jgi:hypothetical protein
LSPIAGSLIRLHTSYFSGHDFLARRGDPLYSLDDYVQGGITTLLGIGPNLRVEAGFVVQDNEGKTNYTFQVYVSWGTAFDIGFLKPSVRPRTVENLSSPDRRL